MLRAAVCLLLAAVPAAANDSVPVSGSDVVYPRTQTIETGGKTVTVRATGAALRKKLFFNVYAVASYLQDGTPADSAEAVAGADAVRMLHLVMERDVDGPTFLDAFRTAIQKAHGGKYDAQLGDFAKALAKVTAQKGDNVHMVYTPAGGLRVQMEGKVNLAVPGAEFARAVWDIYLGPDPIDAGMKRELVSRLGK